MAKKILPNVTELFDAVNEHQREIRRLLHDARAKDFAEFERDAINALRERFKRWGIADKFDWSTLQKKD